MNTGYIEIQDQDTLLKRAARVVVSAQVGSTSLLQRKIKVNYRRACKIMVQLKTAGVVGEFDFERPREVLIKTQEELMPVLQRLKNVI